ncbi:hypothetical protein AAGG52_02105 [Bacillus licheniformis]
MLDLLTDQHPEAEVIGIDLSVNVIEELQKEKCANISRGM